MKRLLFLLSLILLLPVGVYADTCDSTTSEAFVIEDAIVYSYDETTDEYIPTENDIKEGTVIIVQESDDYIRYYKMCDNEGYIDEHYVISKKYLNDIEERKVKHLENWEVVGVSDPNPDIIVGSKIFMYEYPSTKSKKVLNDPVKQNEQIIIKKVYGDFGLIEYNGKSGWIEIKRDNKNMIGSVNPFYNALLFKDTEEVEVCRTVYGDDCTDEIISRDVIVRALYYYNEDSDERSSLFPHTYYIKYKNIEGWILPDRYKVEPKKYSDEDFESIDRTTHIDLTPYFNKYGIYIKGGIGLIAVIVISILLIRAKKNYVPEEDKNKVQTQPFLDTNNQPVNNVNLMAEEPTPQVVQQPVQQVTPPVDLMAAEPVVQQSEQVVNKQPFIMEEEKKEEPVQEQSVNAFTDFKPTDKVE